MKKCNRKIVISILFVLAFALTAISSCHASEINFSNLTDFSLDNIHSYLKETGQENLSINSDVEIPAAPEFINWDATWQDLYVKGGIDVQFKGHKLTVKLGFMRGGFDSYTQTYKTEPVITVENSGSMCPYVSRDQYYQTWNKNSGSMCPYVPHGQQHIWGHSNSKQDGVYIEFSGGTVEITDRTDFWGEHEQVTISYDELLSKWLSFASKKQIKRLGKTYYFVPQVLWNGSQRQFGWVVSENTPLYYTTSMPQDFVELYRGDGYYGYKPKTYSLPLRLTFVLSPTQKNVWEIRQMTDEEAMDAMVDEFESDKNPFTFSFPAATKLKVDSDYEYKATSGTLQSEQNCN